MSASATGRAARHVITSRRDLNLVSPERLNVVTPVTLRLLTRCAVQGRGSTVTQ
jgi:hypothetical protein